MSIIRRYPIFLSVALLSIGSPVSAYAAALIPQSWNGWRWDNKDALKLTLGMNVSSTWSNYVARGANLWSANNYIQIKRAAGSTDANACSMVFGTVQACSASYGPTGWLGYATVITSGTTILAGTVKLNDFYFDQPKYNTYAFRSMIACQEIGHTIGLAHVDVSNTNINLGTCMDYTNDPSGKKGTNGSLSNLTTSSSDMAALDQIYGGKGSSLATTINITGDGYYIDDHHDHTSAVPEPETWAIMLSGLLVVGQTVRSKRAARAPHVA